MGLNNILVLSDANLIDAISNDGDKNFKKGAI